MQLRWRPAIRGGTYLEQNQVRKSESGKIGIVVMLLAVLALLFPPGPRGADL
jgi:hypothetical protein